MWSQFGTDGGPPPPPPQPGFQPGFQPPTNNQQGGFHRPPPPLQNEPARSFDESENFDNDSDDDDGGGLGMTVNMVTSAASMLFGAARPLQNVGSAFAPPPPPSEQQQQPPPPPKPQLFAPPPAPAPIEQFASMLDEEEDEDMTEVDMDAPPSSETAGDVFARPPTPPVDAAGAGGTFKPPPSPAGGFRPPLGATAPAQRAPSPRPATPPLPPTNAAKDLFAKPPTPNRTAASTAPAFPPPAPQTPTPNVFARAPPTPNSSSSRTPAPVFAQTPPGSSSRSSQGPPVFPLASVAPGTASHPPPAFGASAPATPNPPPPETLFSKPPPSKPSTPVLPHASAARTPPTPDRPALFSQPPPSKPPTPVAPPKAVAVFAHPPPQTPTPPPREALFSQPPPTPVDVPTESASRSVSNTAKSTSNDNALQTISGCSNVMSNSKSVEGTVTGAAAAQSLHRITPPASPSPSIGSNQAKKTIEQSAPEVASSSASKKAPSKTKIVPVAAASPPNIRRKLRGPPPLSSSLTSGRTTRSRFKLPTPRKSRSRTPVRNPRANDSNQTPTRNLPSPSANKKSGIVSPTMGTTTGRPPATAAAKTLPISSMGDAKTISNDTVDTTASLSIPPMDHSAKRKETEAATTNAVSAVPETSTGGSDVTEEAPTTAKEEPEVEVETSETIPDDAGPEVVPPTDERDPTAHGNIDNKLPEGWSEATDPATQKIYYYNSMTGETAWERPTQSSTTVDENTLGDGQETLEKSAEAAGAETNAEFPAVDKALSTPAADFNANENPPEYTTATMNATEEPAEGMGNNNGLPEGWSEATDPTTQKIYYFNSMTGETAWERPIQSSATVDNHNLGDGQDTFETSGVDSAVALEEVPSIDDTLDALNLEFQVDSEGANSEEVAVTVGSKTEDDTPVLESLVQSSEQSISNQEHSELPENWMSKLDSSSGKEYYYNTSTMETSWERPSNSLEVELKIKDENSTTYEVTNDATTVDPEYTDTAEVTNEISIESERIDTAAIVDETTILNNETIINNEGDWVETKDPSTGQPFYYNEITGESSWDRPPEMHHPVKTETSEDQVGRQREIEAEPTEVQEEAETVTEGAVEAQTKPEAAIEAETKDPTLPENWTEVEDPNSGNIYFYNTVTEETRWDRPTDGEGLAKESANIPIDDAQPELVMNTMNDTQKDSEHEELITPSDSKSYDALHPLPEHWIEAIDPSSGQTYYHNTISGITSWERPTSNEISNIDDKDPQEDELQTEPETPVQVEASSSISLRDDGPESQVEPGEDGGIVSGENSDVDGLPDGWIEAIDPSSGQSYFYHSESNTVSWERPTVEQDNSKVITDNDDKEEVEAVEANQKSDVDSTAVHNNDIEPEVSAHGVDNVEDTKPLPNGWIESIDPTSQQVYYYNSLTGDVSWERPSSMPEDKEVSELGMDIAQEEEEKSEIEPEVSREDSNESNNLGDTELLDDGWIESFDDKTEQVYYYNSISGQVSWERPISKMTSVDKHEDEAMDAKVSTLAESNSTEIEPKNSSASSSIKSASLNPKSEKEVQQENSDNHEDNNETDDKLPDGWKEMEDPTSGEVYYYNAESGETSWEKPTQLGAEEIDEPTTEASQTMSESKAEPTVEEVEDKEVMDTLPDGWEEMEDPATGEVYYYNADSGETSWEMPNPDRTGDSDEQAVGDTEVMDTLPDGWEEIEDPATGEVYYYNADSGETSWEMPTPDRTGDSDEQAVGVTEVIDTLPDGWEEMEDPTTGEVYYYNTDSGETSWERPIEKGASDIGEPVGKILVEDKTLMDDANDVSPSEDVLSNGSKELENPSSGEGCGSNAESGETSRGSPFSGGESDDMLLQNNAEADGVANLRETLPEGWEEIKDPSSGEIYYYNAESGETSWEKPTQKESEEAVGDVDDAITGDGHPLQNATEIAEFDETDVLQEGWDEMKDPSSGEVYYYNAESGETSWEKPVLKEASSVDEPAGEVPVENGNKAGDVNGSVGEVPVKNGNEAEDVNDFSNVEDTLPDGWEAMEDPSSQEVYYYNAKSGETSWERPIVQEAGSVDETVGEVPVENGNETGDVNGSVGEVPVENGNEAEDINDDSNAEYALPDGWEEMEDPSSGKVYYYNAESGETSWERPLVEEAINLDETVNEAEKVNAPINLADALPDGWEEMEDPSSGEVYYYNAESGETSWEKPILNETYDADAVDEPVVEDSVEDEYEIEETGPSLSKEDALPEGWEEMKDPSSGEIYYYNAESGETSWEKPVLNETNDADTVDEPVGEDALEESEEAEDVDDVSNAKDALPEGWEEIEDPSNGEVYYYNAESGETSWEKPVLNETNEADAVDEHVCEDKLENKHEVKDGAVLNAEDALLEGWEEMKDPSSGEVYYYNAESGETSWEKPTQKDTKETDTVDEPVGGDALGDKVEAEEVDTLLSEEDTLPEGWEEMRDPSSGEVYYYNAESGETSWEMPILEKAGNPDETVSDAPVETGNEAEDVNDISNVEDVLPDGWEEMEDPSSGEVYYYNAESGETSWEKPVEEEATSVDEPIGEDSAEEKEEVEGALQEGWEAMEDPSSGEVYYYNAESGETSWEKPVLNETNDADAVDEPVGEVPLKESEEVEDVDDVSDAKDVLPEGWEAMEDPSSGEVYYYNAESGETSWEKPVLNETNETDAVDEPVGEVPFEESEEVEDVTDVSDAKDVLPEGWEAMEDPSSGEVYYYNAESGETSWEKPVLNETNEADAVDEPVGEDPLEEKEEAEDVTDVSDAKDVLPEGWEAMEDPSSGEVYYYNAESGETSWEKPVVEEATSVDEPVGEDPLEEKEEAEDVTDVSNGKDVLPEGWEAMEDPSSGEVYYYNAESGETSWEKPSLEADSVDEPVGEDPLEEKEEAEDVTDVSNGKDVLPEGWEAMEDPSSGEVYYYNAESGETSWEKPVVEEATSVDEPVGEDPLEEKEEAEDVTDVSNGKDVLPEGWEAMEDPSSGEVYYYNAESGETSWEKPSLEADSVDEPVGEDPLEEKEEAEDVTDVSNGKDVLPEGWEAMEDPSSGEVYYYNAESGETSWEKPSLEADSVDEPVGDDSVEENEEAEDVTDVSNGKDALPEGWEEMKDPSSGEIYYYNAESGETCWEKPMSERTAEADGVDQPVGEDALEDMDEIEDDAALNAGDLLPDGWEEMLDSSSGDIYYFNAESGETSWKRPTEADGATVVEGDEPVAGEAQDSDGMDTLPHGWEEMEDPSSGEVYYYNVMSGETKWERPMVQTETFSRDNKLENIDSSVNIGEIDDGDEPHSEKAADGSQFDLNGEGVEAEDSISVSGPLPEFWVEANDPTSGKIYYYNTLSQQVSWDRPREIEEPTTVLESKINGTVLRNDKSVDDVKEDGDCIESENESTGSVLSPLPEGWVESTDPNSGETYYYNVKSEETSWKRPVLTSSQSLDNNKSRNEVDAQSEHVVASNEGGVEAEESIENNFSNGNRKTGSTESDLPENWVKVDDSPNDVVNICDDWVDVQDPLTQNEKSDKVEDDGIGANESMHALPTGWVESTDPSSGKIFYWNESTGETSWDRPDRNNSSSKNGDDDSRPTPIVEVGNVCDIESERKKFGISGPLILCDERIVTEYIKTKAKSKDILWQLIAIAARSKGRLRSDYGVVDKSGPEAAIVQLLLNDPEYPSQKRKSKNDVVIEEKIGDEIEGKDSIVRVQDLLIRGDRENAIEEAIAIGDFATALLVASMCDADTYKGVALQYARSKFRSDSPMYTTTMLFSGKMESPSKRQSNNWGVKPEELRKNWKMHLAAIINNRTFGWDRIVLSLGDRLNEIGNITEAHFCYMVCGYPITSPTDEETRVALVGSSHSVSQNKKLLTRESLVAYERTEAYEWAKRLGNPHAYFAAFQPFKLIYAMLLADNGELVQAKKFVESIQISLDRGRLTASDISEVSMKEMFDNDVAFEVAYCEIKQRLFSTDGPKSKYRDEVLSGGSLEVVTLKGHIDSSNDGLGRDMKLGKSVSVLHPGESQQQRSSHLNQLDETFMTAKTNLMDRSDYSIGATDNDRSTGLGIASKAEVNVTAAPPESKAKDQSKFAKNPTATAEMTAKQKQQPAEPVAETNAPGLKTQPQNPERPKAAPSTAPAVMTGKGKEKEKQKLKKAPVSSGTPKKAPGSGSFGGMKSKLIKWLNPNAKECHLPENEEQPYFDKDLKRWVFPGDDPAELAKPMAPPPMVIKKEEEVKKEEPKDAISSMMAPPKSRFSAKKNPVLGGPPGGGMMPPMMGGMMMPPGASPSGMITPMGGGPGGASGTPKFATFTPKPAVFTPKPADEASSKEDPAATTKGQSEE